MSSTNKISLSNKPQNNSDKGSSKFLGLIILIIIVVVIFFWRFIDYRTANWVGNANEGRVDSVVNPQPGFVHTPPPINDSPLVFSSGDSSRVAPTVMEYNSEFLRWAGEVAPGHYVTWGKITIESPEIIVDSPNLPKPPIMLKGNIREATGVRIDFMIFDEKNYLAWESGEQDVQVVYFGKNLLDYNYALDISQGSYYIVVENKSATEKAFIGFTGVLSYARDVAIGENPSNLSQNFTYVWNIKNEKLTIWEYVLKIFQSSYNVSVTPPFVSENI